MQADQGRVSLEGRWRPGEGDHAAQESKPAPELLDALGSIREALVAQGLALPSAGTSYTIVVVSGGATTTLAVDEGLSDRATVSMGAREAAATYDADQLMREVAVSCPDLTPREQQILSWIALRMDYREIAAAAGLSYHTVRTHARNIFDKLGIRSRRQAVERFSGFALGGLTTRQKAGPA